MLEGTAGYGVVAPRPEGRKLMAGKKVAEENPVGLAVVILEPEPEPVRQPDLRKKCPPSLDVEILGIDDHPVEIEDDGGIPGHGQSGPGLSHGGRGPGRDAGAGTN